MAQASLVERARTRVRVMAGRPAPQGEGDAWQWNQLGMPRTRLDFAAHRLKATVDARRHRRHWPEVERFCFFVGYPRSGHSLIGSLLNAHPEIVIAHELNAWLYVDRGFRRDQLFGLIVARDVAFGAAGRRWTGYDYTVAGQHQGSFTRLRVVGDKMGGRTSLTLVERPERLDGLRRLVAVPIRALHVTRNPYDNIATMARRVGTSTARAIERYRPMVEAVATLEPRFGSDELVHVAYEDFAARPAEVLALLCERLGVAAGTGYLEAASALVRPPKPTRHDVEWTPADRDAVEALIAAHPRFTRYAGSL